ncbi:thioesterase family protein [Nonomuraea sp. NPDC050451]|uniref:thioesterase family protein n=1 Tax=Nonomuraea sp. NPDC050451 TaxID=3364364 RepID=UPI003797BCC7
MRELKPGLEHTFRFRVPESKIVAGLYPESPEFAVMPPVFATGFLVGLIEWTCVQAVVPYLDWPREQTVGTHVDLSHQAPTPPGLEVTCRDARPSADQARAARPFAAGSAGWGVAGIGATRTAPSPVL